MTCITLKNGVRINLHSKALQNKNFIGLLHKLDEKNTETINLVNPINSAQNDETKPIKVINAGANKKAPY